MLVQCVCVIVISDVTSQGTWTLLNEFEDPELKSLASRLPHTILHSHADSTVKKYVGAFKRWKKWASTYNFDAIPGCAPSFCLVPPALKRGSEVQGCSRRGLQCHIMDAFLYRLGFPNI